MPAKEVGPWIAARCSLTRATCSRTVPWPCTGPGAANRSPGTTRGCFHLLSSLARERTGLPLLRCYWYEATVDGRRTAEHDALADIPGIKLRVAKMRPGRREGVDTEIHRDLTTLARNNAISDALVVSAEEDLAQVIADVQDLGMRVTLVHSPWTATGPSPARCGRSATTSSRSAPNSSGPTSS